MFYYCVAVKLVSGSSRSLLKLLLLKLIRRSIKLIADSSYSSGPYL